MLRTTKRRRGPHAARVARWCKRYPGLRPLMKKMYDEIEMAYACALYWKKQAEVGKDDGDKRV